MGAEEKKIPNDLDRIGIDRNAPVGVFDSGIGGLTVAREIMRQIPEERIVYFGDTARVPYGSKSQDTIVRYSRQIIRFLRTKGVKAIVIACNTASAYALEIVAKESDIPIIGVVNAGGAGSSFCNTQWKDRRDRNGGDCPKRSLHEGDAGDETGHRGDRKGLPAFCSACRGGTLARFCDG